MAAATRSHSDAHSGPGARVALPVTGAVLVILGAVAAFIGAFILLGGEEQSVGLGGDLSWQVGEIHPAWGYGLLAVGLLAMLCAAVLAIRSRNRPDSAGWADVAAHAVVFLLVNALLWIQDIALGDGLDYAYWVTIPWGLGLAAHVVSHLRAHRGGA